MRNKECLIMTFESLKIKINVFDFYTRAAAATAAAAASP